MKSRINFLITFCLVFIISISVTASAKEITVDDNSGADFLSIQEAVNSAEAGDVIIIKPGTYIENINISKARLTIKPETNNVFIKPADSTGPTIVLNDVGTTLYGLNMVGGIDVRNALLGDSEYYKNNMSRITNNVIENGGIDVSTECSGIIISGNRISNGGIYVACCGDFNEIANNTILNCSLGIFVYDERSVPPIRDNKISNCEVGIHVSGYSYDLINNEITNCDIGIEAGDTGGATLVGNKITYCTDCGVKATGSLGTNYNNYFNNTVNVKFESYENTFGWNTALTRGTNIVGGPYIGGNFWAKPDGTGFSQTCVDLDGNGIGDLPYNINKDNYDYLPLVSEYSYLPLTNFNANTSGSDAPLFVQFTDLSQNALSWNWNFGDGSSSIEQNPIHVYTNPGTYTVSLTAANANGTRSKTSTITVGQASAVLPVANFSSNVTDGTAPLAVQFTDLSQNVSSWKWDFNSDGISDSIEQNPVNIYANPGNYTVNLTVSNTNGTASKIQQITVQDAGYLPVAVLGANVTSGYTPLCVQFIDLSQNITSRSWDIGNDGTVDSMDASFIYEFSSRGTYPVNLTISNENGSSSEVITISALRKSSSDGNSGGSSGGSGGAAGSPESAKNVKVKELSQVFITSGKAVKFEFSKNATAIACLSFDSKRTVGKTTTIVEMLKNKSTLTKETPEGELYNYLNIWIGNGGYGSDEDNFENAVINFKVEKSWVQDKGIDKSSITINRYNDKKWNSLPTTFLSEDDKYLYFKAETPGFSPFAITGESTVKEVVTKIEPKTTEEDEENTGNMTAAVIEQEPANKENASKFEKTTSIPGFEIAYGIACLFCMFLYRRQKA